MRECGEDLLVELSEILFNELAFFRLMQDLDDPKKRVKDSLRKWRQDSQTSTETGDDTKDDENTADETSEGSETDESDDSDADDKKTDRKDDDLSEQNDEDLTENETEELGKARDDELASRVDINDLDDDELDKSPFKIMLAPSETKPYTRCVRKSELPIKIRGSSWLRPMKINFV